MAPIRKEVEIIKTNYVYLAIFIILIIPFIAMLDCGISTNLLETVFEYVLILIGFFWTPFILMMAILDWDFEARYSPLLKLAFWTIPPLLFAYSIHNERDKLKDSILAGYVPMIIGMFVSLIVLIVIILIDTIVTGTDPFASLSGV